MLARDKWTSTYLDLCVSVCRGGKKKIYISHLAWTTDGQVVVVGAGAPPSKLQRVVALCTEFQVRRSVQEIILKTDLFKGGINWFPLFCQWITQPRTIHCTQPEKARLCTECYPREVFILLHRRGLPCKLSTTFCVAPRVLKGTNQLGNSAIEPTVETK